MADRRFEGSRHTSYLIELDDVLAMLGASACENLALLLKTHERQEGDLTEGKAEKIVAMLEQHNITEEVLLETAGWMRDGMPDGN